MSNAWRGTLSLAVFGDRLPSSMCPASMETLNSVHAWGVNGVSTGSCSVHAFVMAIAQGT